MSVGSRARSVPPYFREGSAALHRAPTPRAGTGLIDEQQAAVRRLALTDPAGQRTRVQIDHIAREHPACLLNRDRRGDPTACRAVSSGTSNAAGDAARLEQAPGRGCDRVAGNDPLGRVPDKGRRSTRTWFVRRGSAQMTSTSRTTASQNHATSSASCRSSNTANRAVTAGMCEIGTGTARPKPPRIRRGHALSQSHVTTITSYMRTVLNPETLPSNPAFSQVIVVRDPVETIYVGGQDVYG